MALDRFTAEHLRAGRSEEATKDELREVSAAVEEVKASIPSEVASDVDQLIEQFPDLWLGTNLALWKRVSESAQPSSGVDAEARWDLFKLRTLAGLEVFWRPMMEGRLAHEVVSDAANQFDLKDRAKQVLQSIASEMADRATSMMEESLEETRRTLDALDAGVIGLLPEVVSCGKSGAEPKSGGLLGAAVGDAPITCAAALRLVLELQRSRRWYSGSVSGELGELSREKTGGLVRHWDGLIWAASLLWEDHQRTISAQAKLEGKIGKREAELNAKTHLYHLRHVLENEADAVAKLRQGKG
ncbi:MAG: hypothetical protein IIC91_10815 [Chloroflexi bacterium]|nr:hypothetical protein [Chloroflexota bacterium]